MTIVIKDFIVYSKNGTKYLSQIDNPDKEVKVSSGSKSFDHFGLTSNQFTYLIDNGFVKEE